MNQQELVDAIAKRRSVRHYSVSDIPAALRGRLIDPTGIAALGLSHCRVELVYAPGQLDQVFSGIVGSYGKIRGASAALVLIVPEDSKERGMMEAGYIGEQYVLRATALGLGTCWVGGMFKFKTLMGRLSLGPNDKVAALIALGFAQDRPDGFSSLIHRFIKRKKLEEVMEKGLLGHGAWLHKAAQAVRVAPSAAHRQPWYFSGSPDRVVLTAKRAGTWTSMDLGIAMLHFELAARDAGRNGKWYVRTELYFA